MLRKNYATEFNDSLHSSSDEKNEPLTAQILSYCENMLMWFFDFCSYDTTQTRLAFWVQWCIITLQWMCFLSDAYLPYDWKARVSRVFMAICDFVTEFPWHGFTNYWLSTTIVVVFFTFSVITALAMHYRRWVVPVVFMRYLLMWIPTVFYVPLILPHIRMVFGCVSYSSTSYTNHPFYNTMTCWDSGHAGLTVLSVIIGGLFFSYSLISTWYFYENSFPTHHQLDKNAYNSRTTNRPEVFLFLAKSVLLVLYIAGSTNNWRYPMSVILFASGVGAIIYQLRFLPFWEEIPQILALSQAILIAWTGFICFFMTLLNDSEGVGMLYFAFLPVIFIAAGMTLKWRYNVVYSMEERDLTAPHLFELKIHSIIRNFFQYLRTFGDIYIEDTEEIMEKRREATVYVTSLMEIGSQRFPESADFHVFLATFFITIVYNRIICYRELEAASRLSPRFGTRFRIYLIRQMLDQATKAEQSDEVMAYMEFKTRREYVEKTTEEAMRYLVQFWTELLATSPNIEKLSWLGFNARSKLDVTIANYERLLKLNPNSVAVLRTYGLLLLEITGELRKASELMEKADGLEINKKKLSLEYNYGEFLNKLSADLDIFDEDNGIVNISVSKDSMGMIESVNPSFTRIFGYPASTIIGKNVSTLVPEPISTHHDKFIMNYLNTKQSNVVNHVRMVFGVHLQGQLVSCAMHVKWVSESESKMVAVLTPLVNQFEVCAIFDSNTKMIMYATQNLHSIFGFSKRDILAKTIHISQLIPTLANSDVDVVDKVQQAIFSKSGYTTEATHAITDQHFQVHAFARTMVMEGDSFVFVRLVTAQIQNEDDIESEDEMLMEADHEISVADAYIASRAVSPTHHALRTSTSSMNGRLSGLFNHTTRDMDDSTPMYTPNPDMSPLPPYPNPISPRSSPSNMQLGSHSCLSSRISAAERAIAAHIVSPRSTMPHHTFAPSSSSPDTMALVTTTVNAAPVAGGDAAMGINIPALNVSLTAADSEAASFSPARSVHSVYSARSMKAPIDRGLSRQGSLRDSERMRVSLPMQNAENERQLVAGNTDAYEAEVEFGRLSGIDTFGAAADYLSRRPLVRASTEQAPEGSSVVVPLLTHAATSSLHQSSIISVTAYESISVDNRDDRNDNLVVPASAAELDGSLHDSLRAAKMPKKDKTSAVESVASTSSSLRNKRTSQGHRRLLRAINNDNVITVRKLKLMQIFSILMIVGTLVLNVGLFAAFAIYMDEVAVILDNAYKSSQREAHVTDALYAYRGYVFTDTHGDSHGVMQPQALIERTITGLDNVSKLSYIVDNRSSRHPDLMTLRTKNVVEVMKMEGGIIKRVYMPLRAAFSYYSAMARFSVYNNIGHKESQDIGYFFALANGATSIRDGAAQNTGYLVEEVQLVYDEVIIITIVIFVLSLALVLFVSLVFVRPIVLRLELSKTEVLHIFQSVPYSIRKTLRRKAYNIYNTVRKDNHDDKSTRDLRDEDEAHAESFHGGASHIGSDFTVNTKVSAVTSASGHSSSYANMFKRYQRMKQNATNTGESQQAGMSTSASARVSTSFQTELGSQRYGGMGPHEQVHIGAKYGVADVHTGTGTGAGQAKVHSARSHMMERVISQSHAIASARPVLGSRGVVDTDKMSVVDENGREETPSKAESGGVDHGDEHGVMVFATQSSAKSGCTALSVSSDVKKNTDIMSDMGKSIMELSQEDEERVGKESTQSVYSRRVFQILTLKFLIFLAIIAVYFALCLWQSNENGQAIISAVETMNAANKRYPALVMALFMARQHIFFDYEESLLETPLNPALQIGNFLDVGRAQLALGQQYHHAILYGNLHDIDRQNVDAAQTSLLYSDSCEIAPSLLSQVTDDPSVIAAFDSCDEFMSGIFKKGMYTALLQTTENLNTMLQPTNKKVLNHVLLNKPKPADLMQVHVDSILTLYRDTESLLGIYLFYLLAISGSLYNTTALNIMDAFASVRLLFMIIFSCILIVAYFLLFEGNARALSTAALQTKSMMLLLPPDILKHVTRAQAYIDEHISSD